MSLSNSNSNNNQPTNQINQDDINKAVWNDCDTFRGVISADTYY
ncbi:hypothetical protein [Psychrobacter sp. S1-30-MNA-CIBAN-0213]